MSAQTRYVINLAEALVGNHGPNCYIVRLNIGRSSPVRELTCGSLRDVLEAADAFATEHGDACHIRICCLDRKPLGFDEATRYQAMFRNMHRARRE
jgi:hypothetical protein